jgi:hypothetical protein
MIYVTATKLKIIFDKENNALSKYYQNYFKKLIFKEIVRITIIATIPFLNCPEQLDT